MIPRRVPPVVEDSAALFEGARRHVLFDAVCHVLRHQYVSSPLSKETSRVLRGCGMGLKHSTGIASARFHKLGDQWITQPGLMRQFEIRLYARYVDDLFLITSEGKGKMELFNRWLRSRVSPVFSLEFVAEHQQSVEVLDLRVSIVDGSVRWEPRRCQTAAPLSVDSAHPPHCHASWPVAMTRYVHRLCSHPAAFRTHGDLLMHRFSFFSSPPWVLARLRRCFDELLSGHIPPRRVCTPSPRNWLPVSWHPMWASGLLQKHVARLRHDPAWAAALEAELGYVPSVGKAWKRGFQHFVHSVHRRTLAN